MIGEVEARVYRVHFLEEMETEDLDLATYMLTLSGAHADFEHDRHFASVRVSAVVVVPARARYQEGA